MASGKGIDGKREIFLFSGYISSNKDTWLIDSSSFKHMIGYERILADLDLLLFLKCTHVTLSHVIWIILFRNQMMISRRQEDPGQSQRKVKKDPMKLWEMVDFLINLLALII